MLKLKESNVLLNLMQWGVSFLMGISYPVVVLPPFRRGMALLFRSTWMTNGVPSALLGWATGFIGAQKTGRGVRATWRNIDGVGIG